MSKVATTDDVKTIVNDAVDTLLKGMDNLYERFKGEVDGLRTEMKAEFDKMGGRLEGVETELFHVKDDIKGIKADLADTPSRREFEALKSQVERQYP